MQDSSKLNLKLYRAFARDESLAYHLYMRLAKRQKKAENRIILENIANQEKQHLEMFNAYLGSKAVKIDAQMPSFKLQFYTVMMYVLGIIFTLRIFEKNEIKSRHKYNSVIKEMDPLNSIIHDEKAHEEALVNILNDEKLLFASSIVLGMNDALVEISGALAGFTLALSSTREVALIGLITGISAALSMASSEYLSRVQDDELNPLIYAVYNGITYILVVSMMILPYFLIEDPVTAVLTMLGIVITIIFGFNYYISIAKKQNLMKNFLRMTLIAMTVATISFLIGLWVDTL